MSDNGLRAKRTGKIYMKHVPDAFSRGAQERRKSGGSGLHKDSRKEARMSRSATRNWLLEEWYQELNEDD